MSAFCHLPYRPGVGMMLINPAGRVFVGKRIDQTSDAWQMPQGGIDEGESPEIAARRELWEEAGVRDARLLAVSADWYRYDLPDALVPNFWGGRFRGQEQRWFLFRLEGDDSAINIATEHPEFMDWQWVTPAALPDLIVPFKRELYQAVLSEFQPHLFAANPLPR